MRKPAFCICENKDAGNREADQRLCFRYTDSTIPLLSIRNFKLLAIFCGCTAWFVSDLVENPEDRFSQNEAHSGCSLEPQRCTHDPCFEQKLEKHVYPCKPHNIFFSSKI